MKRERDALNQKIVIAETLAVSFGMDLITPDGSLGEAEAETLNEIVREYVRKGGTR